MSDYVVHEEWKLRKADIPSKPPEDISGDVYLMPGDTFSDGDIDGDLVADLLMRGVIARVGEEPQVVTVPEDKPKKSKPKKVETTG